MSGPPRPSSRWAAGTTPSTPTTGGPSRRWPGWTAWPSGSCSPTSGVDLLEAEMAAPLLVLSEPEFEAAVRQALRDYTRPAALAASPLLRSRLASQAAAGTPTAATLQELLRSAAQALAANPRDERLYRALACTFFEPAATQELAAERLGLPFSTYRYQLAGGIRRVTERLWHRELHGDQG